MVFRKLGKKALRCLYDCYLVHDFPASERKEKRTLLKGMGNGSYITLGGFDEVSGDMLCYAIVMVEKKTAPTLVDYFAVVPEKRDSGIGSQAMRLFQTALPFASGILVEYENPEDECDNRQIRVKREAFYLRNGFRRTNIDVTVFGNHYCIGFLPFGEDVPDAVLRRELARIYRVFHYGRNNVRFHDER